MTSIRLPGITWGDLEDILFRDDERPDQEEIPDDDWDEILDINEGVAK